MAVLAACSAPSERAGAEYVKASRKLMDAESEFARARYVEALNLARSARDGLKGILKNYPSSPVALRLVSDPGIAVASYPYGGLESKLLPKLELAADPLMKPVSVAWALAVWKSEGRADRIALFASLLAENRAELKIPPRDFQKMEALCVENIPGYAEKSALVSRLEKTKNPPPAKGGETSPKTPPSASTAKIENAEDFLASAGSDASLVSYELRAVDSLVKKATLAGAAGGEIQKRFLEILERARGNVMKISAESVRETALSNLAAAFADAGGVAEAVDIARSLKDPRLFESVFNAVADRAGNGKNYVSALGLAERLKDGAAKDEFIFRVASGVANRGLFRESVEVGKRIKSVRIRNKAFAVAAKRAMEKGDREAVLGAVSPIDAGDLSFLDVFDFPAPGGFKENGASLRAYRLAVLSGILAPYGAELARAVNNLAVSACRKAEENFSEISRAVVSNFVKLGAAEDALDFITGNMPKIRPGAFVSQICSAAVEISKSDTAAAEKYFSTAAAMSDNSVEIAFAMLRARIPLERQVEILGARMPTMLSE